METMTCPEADGPFSLLFFFFLSMQYLYQIFPRFMALAGFTEPIFPVSGNWLGKPISFHGILDHLQKTLYDIEYCIFRLLCGSKWGIGSVTMKMGKCPISPHPLQTDTHKNSPKQDQVNANSNKRTMVNLNYIIYDSMMSLGCGGPKSTEFMGHPVWVRFSKLAIVETPSPSSGHVQVLSGIQHWIFHPNWASCWFFEQLLSSFCEFLLPKSDIHSDFSLSEPSSEWAPHSCP